MWYNTIELRRDCYTVSTPLSIFPTALLCTRGTCMSEKVQDCSLVDWVLLRAVALRSAQSSFQALVYLGCRHVLFKVRLHGKHTDKQSFGVSTKPIELFSQCRIFALQLTGGRLVRPRCAVIRLQTFVNSRRPSDAGSRRQRDQFLSGFRCCWSRFQRGKLLHFTIGSDGRCWRSKRWCAWLRAARTGHMKESGQIQVRGVRPGRLQLVGTEVQRKTGAVVNVQICGGWRRV